MSKKTAVQEAIEVLGNRLIMILNEPNELVRSTMIHNFVMDENRFLALEKQQIEDAYKMGCEDTYGIDDPSPDDPDDENAANDYYTQTYIANN